MEFSLLNLLLVLVVAWLAGLLAARLGYPSVLGELLAGIVLGPPLLGLLEGSQALAVLAEVGILLMMLYIGMEIDPKELGKASKAGLLAALGGFITPFLLCFGAMLAAGYSVMAAVFVGVAAGVTSLATKSRILVDLHLLDTRVAHVLMAGALIADTLSLVIFAAIIGLGDAGSVNAASLGLVAVKAVAFFVVAGVIGLRVFPWLGRRLQGRTALGRTASFTLLVIVAFGFAELAELAGLHGILGAFLAGLFLRESTLGRTLAHDLMHLVRDVSLGLLAPIFFVTAGFAVTLDVFTENLGLLAAIVALATLGKIVGTTLFYLPTGHGWREGLTVGAGMNGRGAVEIIVAQIGLTMGLINETVFSILVFMAIFTTATVPLFLKWGVDWLRGRGELVRSGERAGTLIVGAGPTARLLGRTLAATQPVAVLDRNPRLCELAAEEGITAVCGNALDEQVLSKAGAARVQHLVACTPNPEVNTLVAQLGRTLFLIPEVHVIGGVDEVGRAALRDHVGATILFGRAVGLADWDYRLGHSLQGVERYEVAGPDPLPEAALPLALERAGRRLPYHSGLTPAPGDVVLALPGQPVPFDRFDRLVAACPVLDLDGPLSLDDFLRAVVPMLASVLGRDAEALHAQLASREATSSTVLLPGLAIPHVSVEGRGQFHMLVARCREGIAFPGAAEPVRTAFVLAGTEDERNFHLRALSAIAQIVQDAGFEAAWLAAPDAASLRQLLLRSARRRLPDPGLQAVSQASPS